MKKCSIFQIIDKKRSILQISPIKKYNTKADAEMYVSVLNMLYEKNNKKEEAK